MRKLEVENSKCKYSRNKPWNNDGTYFILNEVKFPGRPCKSVRNSDKRIPRYNTDFVFELYKLLIYYNALKDWNLMPSRDDGYSMPIRSILAPPTITKLPLDRDLKNRNSIKSFIPNFQRLTCPR
jgi:hypothetical protein